MDSPCLLERPGEELQSSAPATVVLQDPVYVGIGICSHDASVLVTFVSQNRVFGVTEFRDESRGDIPDFHSYNELHNWFSCLENTWYGLAVRGDFGLSG